MAHVAGYCGASIIKGNTTDAVRDEISAKRASSATVLSVISINAAITSLCYLIAGVALVDVDTAGYTGSSDIIDDVVRDA